MSKLSAVFLDRDGVINSDPGYISDPANLHLYPYSAEAVRILNSLDYLVIVVTNQSGIARGYFTARQIEAVHQKMRDELAKQKACIDKIYFSPYHKDGSVQPYNISHPDRKPQTGMFQQAKIEFNLDPSASFMIGDRLSDMIFAHRAGLVPILVLSGDGKTDLLQRPRMLAEFKPAYIAQDLLAAANLIKLLKEGF
jgi:D,D-heptose 1,7-bisphosphate phosphatase